VVVASFTPGQRLHDRFVLVELIGTGGMSQVWRATDEVLGRPVAVKALVAEIAADPALRAATWREARAAARLTHPNITRVYDYGEAPLPDGTRAPYLVMELVEGQSLAGRVAAGPLPWPEVARIGAQVAAALAAAHELGVVHHDVKPGNVMLTASGAKVLDFGTAALVGAIDQDVLVGTPSYTAPERLEWAPAQPASDVYSLGVLLHEALTGAPPAALASWAEAGDAHRAGRGSPTGALPDLPPGAGELLRACRSPDPAQRPPARELATALAALAGVPDPATSITREPPTVAARLPPAPAAPDPRSVGPAAPDPRSVGPAAWAPGSVALAAAGPAAVGSAAVLPRPTMIDDRSPDVPAPRGGSRLMLAGIAVTAVLVGLAVGLAIALSRPDQPGAPPGAPPTTGQPASAPASAAGADPRVALAGIDQAISEAAGTGLLDPKTASKLRDKLREVVRELEKPGEAGDRREEKVRDKADDLLAEIEDLAEDGEVPPQLAAELRDRLAPFGG
jgi:serine/threonine-protein kinase